MASSTFTTGGLIFMALSWGSIILLNIFCFYKIFGEKKSKIVGPLEVEAEMDRDSKKS